PVELEQRLHFRTGLRHWSPIRASRQHVQDLRGARGFFGCGLRGADVQPTAAWCVARPTCIEWTSDRDLRDARRSRRRVVDAVGSIDVRFLHERDRDRVWTGLDWQTQLSFALQVYWLTVHRHVDVLCSGGDDRADAARSAWTNLQVVVGIQRKRVADDHAAARPERQTIKVILLR